MKTSTIAILLAAAIAPVVAENPASSKIASAKSHLSSVLATLEKKDLDLSRLISDATQNNPAAASEVAAADGHASSEVAAADGHASSQVAAADGHASTQAAAADGHASSQAAAAGAQPTNGAAAASSVQNGGAGTKHIDSLGAGAAILMAAAAYL